MLGKKASIVLLGFVLAGLAFFFGYVYNDIPEFADQKYLMPNKYRTHLRAQVYKVWYFPKWTQEGQKRPMGEVDQKEVEVYLSDLPRVILESNDSGPKAGEVLMRQFTPPTKAGKGYKFAMQIGEFQVEKPGAYLISASREGASEKFVIAIVPPMANSGKRDEKTASITEFDDELVTH